MKRRPYDSAHKSLFSWIHELDLNSLERVPSNFISKELIKREGDIIWKAKWGGKDVYLLLWLEFQSRVDRFMANRLCSYITLFYDQLIKEKKLVYYIPPVLPIVLYCGEDIWHAPVCLYDLYYPNIPENLLPFRANLNFFLFDEKRQNPVKTKDGTPSWFGFILRFQKANGREEFLDCLVELGNLLFGQEKLRHLAQSMAAYINEICDGGELLGATTKIDFEEVFMNLKERLMTTSEEQKEKWMKEGEAKCGKKISEFVIKNKIIE